MRPDVWITETMIEVAYAKAPHAQVQRTRTSRFDTVYGLLGEYCFAQWLFGTWIEHSDLNTKGRVDFLDLIEVKTSAFPFSERLNLLVREDYAKKRKPSFYVQTIIDLPDRAYDAISPDLKCIIAGYATSIEVEAAPARDFGSKFGGGGGYRCKYIAIKDLRPVQELRQLLNSRNHLPSQPDLNQKQ